ncbi:unnamed protein product, partial [marine sediment metagenome]
PPGHNLNGFAVTVEADDDAGFGTPTALVTAQAVTDDGWQEFIFSGDNSEQYLRVTFVGTAVFQVSELIYTKPYSPDRGVEQGWTNEPAHNVLTLPSEPGLDGSIVLGADRQRYRLAFRNISDQVDIDFWNAFIPYVKTARPFLLYPAYTDGTRRWVKMSRDSRQNEDPNNPAATDREQKRITIEALEHIA